MLMLQVAGENEDDEDVEAREDFVAPDNEDEDRGAECRKRGNSGGSQDSASKRNRDRASSSRKKKGAKSTPNVMEILTEMLLENRRRDRETVTENLFDFMLFEMSCVICLMSFEICIETVFIIFLFVFCSPQLEESATRQPDEREARGSWLQTVVRNCPKERFRQFQAETLALAQRYQPTDEGQCTSGQQCPAPPPARPVMFLPHPAASQFPAQGQLQLPSAEMP